MALLLIQRLAADARNGRGRCGNAQCKRHWRRGIAAGREWPRRVKEQVFRTRQAGPNVNLTCLLAGAPLLLGVLRPGAGNTTSRYCRSVGRLACRPAPISRCGRSSLTDVDACRASTLNSVLPGSLCFHVPAVSRRSRLWATSCAPAWRVRAADFHHLPIWRLRGTQNAGDGPGWWQPEV
ncbi:hypothetical protein D3C86_1277950 [compost metagenome]